MKITRRTEQEINISELKAAIKEGRGLEVIRPHDEITLALDTGETITPVCGYVGKHSARFVFKDCLREMWQMNKDMTNKGGYFRSEARRHVLEDILPHLPAELREAITPRHLCEEIDGETYEYFDSLWLPSATDVFGNDQDGWWKEETDSFQLPIFKEERDRVKEVPGNGTYPYWLRSPLASYSAYFVFVYADGTVKYRDVDRYHGVNINCPDAPYHSGLIDTVMDELYPITMPYMPADRAFKIYTEDFLVDPANGDYDTVGILYVITPSMDKVAINRYFKEAPNGFAEIDEAEYKERKEAAKARMEATDGSK